MLLKPCTQYASKFGKLSSGHRTGKGQFSFQSQRRAMLSYFFVSDLVSQIDQKVPYDIIGFSSLGRWNYPVKFSIYPYLSNGCQKKHQMNDSRQINVTKLFWKNTYIDSVPESDLGHFTRQSSPTLYFQGLEGYGTDWFQIGK